MYLLGATYFEIRHKKEFNHNPQHSKSVLGAVTGKAVKLLNFIKSLH